VLTFDRYFRFTDRGTTARTEMRGGLATFFTMAYIVVLNPLILSGATDKLGRHLPLAQVATSTALVAAVMTLAMGIFGRYPFALAAGLGINGVVAFSLAPQMSWPAAMGIVVLEGLAITVLVVTGFREAVFDAIPMALKQAISVGIGLFIAFIGFVDAGFVRRSGADPVPVSLGPNGRLIGWPSVVFCFGLLLTGLLVARRTKAAILIGIVSTTVFAMVVNALFDVPPQVVGGKFVNPGGWGLNVPKFPHKFVSSPDFGLVGHFSLTGGVKAVGVVSTILLVYTLMLADFFDTMGTVVGVGAEGGLLDEKGRLPGLGRVLLVDSLAAVAGGATSSSPCSSPRWSRSFPMRRRRRRWWSSASC